GRGAERGGGALRADAGGTSVAAGTATASPRQGALGEQLSLYHLRSLGPCDSLTDGGRGGFEPRLLQRTGVADASPAWRVRSRRCYGPRTACRRSTAFLKSPASSRGPSDPD